MSLHCKFHLIPKLKQINNKSFLCILLLLSVDITLNPGPVYNNQSLHSNEWNVFRSKGIHLVHLNLDSLLPKTDEIHYIAERTKAAVIGITESTLVLIAGFRAGLAGLSLGYPENPALKPRKSS